jgi:hypothetical protein
LVIDNYKTFLFSVKSRNTLKYILVGIRNELTGKEVNIIEYFKQNIAKNIEELSLDVLKGPKKHHPV